MTICKLKWQWDTTIQPLECLKLVRLTKQCWWGCVAIGISYCYMQQHGRILKACAKWKRHSQNSIYTVWLQIYDSLEKASIVTESKAMIARCHGWKGIDRKETEGTFWDDECVYVLIVIFNIIVAFAKT